MLEKAERVIESESIIVLTRRESLRLLELIDNPPPRNKKFLQAQARYQRTKNQSDERRLPFEVKVPSKSSRKALAEIAAGKVKTFATVDALMADLHADD